MEFKKINTLKVVCQVFKIIGIVLVVQSTIVVLALAFIMPSVKNDLGNEGVVMTLAPFGMFFFGWASTIVFFVGIYKLIFNAYRISYKNYFAHKVLSKYLKEYKYAQRHTELANEIEELIKSTGMIADANLFKTEDYITGTYNGVEFTQADFHPRGIRGMRDPAVFRGRWLVFKFPKRFTHRVGIIGRNYGFVSWGKNAGMFTDGKFKRFEVESSEFNKRFIVLAEDGPEAFYILDPSLIEKIQKLGEKYERKIVICFSDNYLQIGINDGVDLFEPSKKLTLLSEEKEFAKLDAEVQPIMDLVDSLGLSKKVFMAN
jgi:hypothetical protein